MEKFKENIKEIMVTQGKVRGAVFQTDAEFVRQEKGEKGIEALEEETRRLGYHIDYSKIKATEWLPIGLRIVSLLAAQKAFGWGEREFFSMGEAAPKCSFIVKMLMRAFLSPKKSFEETPTYWKKHYTVGEIEAREFNEDKKCLVLRLRGFDIHPLVWPYLRGYFLTMSSFVLKGAEINIKEKEYCSKEDSYHEFLIEWK